MNGARLISLNERSMFFAVFIFILLFSNTNLFLISIQNKHIFIECGRSVIIQNHYWFLSELLKLLKTLNRNRLQSVPYDHLNLIFNQIFIHCQPAYQFYQAKTKVSTLDQVYGWLKTQIDH